MSDFKGLDSLGWRAADASAADAWWAGLEEQERGGKFFACMCGTLAAARVG